MFGEIANMTCLRDLEGAVGLFIGILRALINPVSWDTSLYDYMVTVHVHLQFELHFQVASSFLCGLHLEV